MTIETQKYTSLELFSGAGGLALGLEQAGFYHIGLIDWDSDSIETLKKNKPHWNAKCVDIKKIAEKDLLKEFKLKEGELDLLSGGAPCQSFSFSGNRLGIQDDRGSLFYYYASFLQKLKPKMFLFENVKGLINHDKGKTLQIILDTFKSQGYRVSFKVLNAWDYGVAQKRERLFIIGIRSDLENKSVFEFPKKQKYKPVLEDILKDVPPSLGDKYSSYKRKIFELVPPGGYWRDIPEDIAKEYMKKSFYLSGGKTGILRRLSLKEPSLTVLTHPQMKQTDRCHPIEVRPFTVRENARIQSFPDDWIFVGNMLSQYRQVGNAVPCALAKEIGLKLIEQLSLLKSIV